MPVPIRTKVEVDTKEVSTGVAKVDKLFGGLKAKAGLAATAVTAIASGFVLASMQKLSEHLTAVDRNMKKLDASAGAIQRIGLAAEIAGGNVDQVADQLIKIRNIAALGDDTTAKNLEAIGLNMKEVNNMDADALLLAIAKGYNSIADNTERSAAMAKLFGDEYKELLPVISDYDALLKDMEDTAIISEEEIKRIKEAEAELAKLSNSLTVLSGKTIKFVFDGIDNFKELKKLDDSGEMEKSTGVSGKKAAAFSGSLLPGGFALATLFTKKWKRDKSNKELTRDFQDDLAKDQLTQDPDYTDTSRFKPGDEVYGPEPPKTLNFDLRNKPKPDNNNLIPGLESVLKLTSFFAGNDNQIQAISDQLNNTKQGIENTKGLLAGTPDGTVVADSLAKIGGGGLSNGAINPEVKLLTNTLKVLEDTKKVQEQALEALKSNNGAVLK